VAEITQAPYTISYVALSANKYNYMFVTLHCCEFDNAIFLQLKMMQRVILNLMDPAQGIRPHLSSQTRGIEIKRDWYVIYMAAARLLNLDVYSRTSIIRTSIIRISRLSGLFP